MRIGINAHLLAFSGNYRQAGLSRHIYELVTRAPTHAPRDLFFAAIGNAPIPPDFRASAPANLRLLPSRLPTHRAPVRIAWEQTALPLLARRARLDLLHCPVNVVPLLSLVPTALTIHDLIFLRYPQGYQPAKRLYLTLMTRLSVRRAARVIAVSETTRRDVITLLGLPARRVVTVQNGVGEEFKPLPGDRIEKFRREKGISGRILLYVGTLEPRKNVETAIRSFKELARDPDMADVRLVIGGSKGWYYDTIFEEARNSGLLDDGRVSFLGRVPDEELPLWYNVASAFVYPSRYEGFGLPALEAMSCGTPVIASTTAALQEVVADTGLMHDPDDTPGWAAAMRALLTNNDLAATLSSRALQRASTFSWTRCAQQTVHVYHSILRPKNFSPL